VENPDAGRQQLVIQDQVMVALARVLTSVQVGTPTTLCAFSFRLYKNWKHPPVSKLRLCVLWDFNMRNTTYTIQIPRHLRG
jgi:hypothetical protein